MFTIRNFIQYIVLGTIAAIPGILLVSFLNRHGILEKHPTWVHFLVSILLAIFWLYLFPQAPWWLIIILLLIANIFGPLRGDLWITFRRGKWWWKKE